MTKKVALCVGQNTYDRKTGVPPLKGCVNDALLIGELLRVAGFQVRQVHDQAAVQKGILNRLSAEVAKLRAGDFFVLWNSSHGYQIRDRSGDELFDYHDEAICTYDTDVREPLTDDKLGQVLSRANPDAHVFIGSDSCHSGTLTRQISSEEQRQPRLYLPPPDVVFRSGSPVLDLDKYIDGMAARHEQMEEEEVRHFGRLARHAAKSEMAHLLLSGCKAGQVSWDAKFPPGFHGAMTYNFAIAVLEAWRKGQAITYREAHEGAVKGIRDGGFDQEPQLEGCEELKNSPVFGHTATTGRSPGR